MNFVRGVIYELAPQFFIQVEAHDHRDDQCGGVVGCGVFGFCGV